MHQGGGVLPLGPERCGGPGVMRQQGGVLPLGPERCGGPGVMRQQGGVLPLGPERCGGPGVMRQQGGVLPLGPERCGGPGVMRQQVGFRRCATPCVGLFGGWGGDVALRTRGDAPVGGITGRCALRAWGCSGVGVAMWR